MNIKASANTFFAIQSCFPILSLDDAVALATGV